MSDVILTSAAAIANEWRLLAAAWHVVVAAAGITLWWRRVDARFIAALLSLMAFSVAAMAAWSGNPFNATTFGIAGVAMAAFAATQVNSQSRLASGPGLAVGSAMCAFGWFYPHFLEGPAWHYAYAAPLGLLPCPTLAFIIGASLLAISFGSKAWAIGIGALGLVYGLMGVFLLGVMIDWLLSAGAVLLLAAGVAPAQLPGLLTIDQGKGSV